MSNCRPDQQPSSKLLNISYLTACMHGTPGARQYRQSLELLQDEGKLTSRRCISCSCHKNGKCCSFVKHGVYSSAQGAAKARAALQMEAAYNTSAPAHRILSGTNAVCSRVSGIEQFRAMQKLPAAGNLRVLAGHVGVLLYLGARALRDSACSCRSIFMSCRSSYSWKCSESGAAQNEKSCAKR